MLTHTRLRQAVRRWLAALAALALLALWACGAATDATWRAHDACIRIGDGGGATSRYRTFTPERCSAPGTRIGEPVGADHGELHYADVDGDGRTEAIIESSRWRCLYGATPCYDAYRIVLAYCEACSAHAKVQVRSREWLADLTPPGTPPPPK